MSVTDKANNHNPSQNYQDNSQQQADLAHEIVAQQPSQIDQDNNSQNLDFTGSSNKSNSRLGITENSQTNNGNQSQNKNGRELTNEDSIILQKQQLSVKVDPLPSDCFSQNDKEDIINITDSELSKFEKMEEDDNKEREQSRNHNDVFPQQKNRSTSHDQIPRSDSFNFSAAGEFAQTDSLKSSESAKKSIGDIFFKNVMNSVSGADQVEKPAIVKEDKLVDYEEGIFVFRAKQGLWQIPCDESVYLQKFAMEDYQYASSKEIKNTQTDLSNNIEQAPEDKEDWEYAQKIVVYDAKSLYLFHHTKMFRRMIVGIAENKMFDILILSLIVINSFSMALQDFHDLYLANQAEETYQLNTRNKIMEQIGFYCSVIFIIECVIKIVAQGFILHYNGYLRDAWNWIDFIVVVTSIIEIFGSKASIKSLRTLRVLRPLRSIKSLPAMRRLIGSLLSSIPALSYALLFLLFVFGLFGIAGLQQFSQTFYQRCRLYEEPNEEGFWEYDLSVDRICSMDKWGDYQCPETTWGCGTPLDKNLPLISDHQEQQSLIHYGLMSFDNLIFGVLTVFQMITLEGWTNVMYNLSDGESPYVATFFCILVVFICSIYLLNIVLAILSAAITNEDDQQKNENREKLRITKSMERAINQKIQKAKADDCESPCLSPSPMLSSKHRRRRSSILKRSTESFSLDSLIIESSESKANENVTIMHDYATTPIRSTSLQALDMQVKHDYASQPVGVNKTDKESSNEKLVKFQDEECLINKSSPNTKELGTQNEPSCFNDQDDEKQSEVSINFDNTFEDDPSPPTHSQRNCCFNLSYKIVSHGVFSFFIIVIIMANTFALALDSDDLTSQQIYKFDLINKVFTYIFICEMFLKILGLGFKEYIRDSYNQFDAIVVGVSIVEIVAEKVASQENAGTGGVLSALRGIRLLRVFKLARSWKSFSDILASSYKTLLDIRMFMILLMLFFFIFMLLGLDLFAFKVRFDDHGQPDLMNDLEFNQSPRENFDDPFNGLITIFIVMVGDNWNTIMYDHYRVFVETNTTFAYISVAFFIILFIATNLILLNLFLAILLNNFTSTPKDEEIEDEQDDELDPAKDAVLLFWYKMRICCARCAPKLCPSPPGFNEQLEQAVVEAQIIQRQISEAKNAKSSQVLVDENESLSKSSIGTTSTVKRQTTLTTLRVTNFIKNNEHIQNLKNRMQKEKGIKVQENNQEEMKLGNKIAPLNAMKSMVAKTSFEKVEKDGMLQRASTLKVNFRLENGIDLNDDSILNLKNAQTSDFKLKDQGKITTIAASALRIAKAIQEKDRIQQQRQSLDYMSSAKTTELGQLKKLENSKTLKTKRQKNKIVLQGRSLFLLSKDNMFRVWLKNIVGHERFENGILFLIVVSTFLLCLDNPTTDLNSMWYIVLQYSDKIITYLFIAEAVIKILVTGFLFNGSQSYLRVGWNILDFIIVAASTISLLPFAAEVAWIRIIRLVRILRPLRILSRNIGMQIAVESLINSAPGIGNLMLIAGLVLLLFSILGTNFYKGLFWSCDMATIPFHLQKNVKTQWECLDYGGVWVNQDSNFDNVGNSVLTLFASITTEGWTDVMWLAIDSTKKHYQPVRDYSMLQAIFFLLLIFISSIFMMNLFVGVVLNNFLKEKEKLVRNDLLTKLQMEYCDTMISCYTIRPKGVYVKTGNRFRDNLHELAENPKFELFVFICIALNTLALSIQWTGMNDYAQQTLTNIGYGFAVVYTIECIIKLIVYGKLYFQDGWNIFDFMVVIAAWLGFILEKGFNVQIKLVTSSFRTFRVARIFKMVKRLKQLNKIFMTFITALPNLANSGALLMLLLLLYSVAGQQLFYGVMLNDALNYHTNFQTFTSSFLTVIRMTTGEAWNEIMYASTRTRAINYQCSHEEQNYEYIVEHGEIQGCGSPLMVIYFVSYQLLGAYIILNLFIAIILESYEKTQLQDEMRINEQTINTFIQAWKDLDPKASGYIPVDDLENLLLSLIKIEIENVKTDTDDEEVSSKTYLFNLHKHVPFFIYVKHKLHLDQDDPVMKGMKKSAYFRNIKKQQGLKILSELKIPAYKNMKFYNFHDTLVSLVRFTFSVQHKIDVQNRKDRITQLEEFGIALSKWDQIVIGSPAFEKLNLTQQEKVLEDSQSDFKLVLNRFESKGINQKKQKEILRITQMKLDRIQAGEPYKDELDEYNELIFDSSHVFGVRILKKYIKELKHKKTCKKLPFHDIDQCANINETEISTPIKKETFRGEINIDEQGVNSARQIQHTDENQGRKQTMLDIDVDQRNSSIEEELDNQTTDNIFELSPEKSANLDSISRDLPQKNPQGVPHKIERENDSDFKYQQEVIDKQQSELLDGKLNDDIFLEEDLAINGTQTIAKYKETEVNAIANYQEEETVIQEHAAQKNQNEKRQTKRESQLEEIESLYGSTKKTQHLSQPLSQVKQEKENSKRDYDYAAYIESRNELRNNYEAQIVGRNQLERSKSSKEPTLTKTKIADAIISKSLSEKEMRDKGEITVTSNVKANLHRTNTELLEYMGQPSVSLLVNQAEGIRKSEILNHMGKSNKKNTWIQAEDKAIRKSAMSFLASNNHQNNNFLKANKSDLKRYKNNSSSPGKKAELSFKINTTNTALKAHQATKSRKSMSSTGRINIDLPNISKQNDIKLINQEKYKLILADREQIKQPKRSFIPDSYKIIYPNSNVRLNAPSYERQTSIERPGVNSENNLQQQFQVNMSMMQTIQNISKISAQQPLFSTQQSYFPQKFEQKNNLIKTTLPIGTQETKKARIEAQQTKQNQGRYQVFSSSSALKAKEDEKNVNADSALQQAKQK